jgi:hypothetical protein
MLQEFASKPNRMTILTAQKFAKLLIPAILGPNREKKKLPSAVTAAPRWERTGLRADTPGDAASVE